MASWFKLAYLIWTQLFPPSAPLTEANLPNQAGKVFLITGASSGIGYELARILYAAGGKVYILTRSEERARDAIDRIKKQCQDSAKTPGSLISIPMDLSDFSHIKAAAQKFLELEGPDGRLDILFNNGGTGPWGEAPPSAQGLEYHMAVNTLGHHLLTHLLTPILTRTANTSPVESVRVIWPASILVEMMAPRGGIAAGFLEDTSTVQNHWMLYTHSKVANWFLAAEFSRRQQQRRRRDGPPLVHLAANPGSYASNVFRHSSTWLYGLMWPGLRPCVHGAETYLWMAFSPDVTLADAAAGRYATCDGRWHPGQRDDLLLALRTPEEGGTGQARAVYDWCDVKVGDFLD